MSAGEFRSFAITLRPKMGVKKDGTLEKNVLKWCADQDYAIVCAEKELEERHLHIQIWLDKPRTKGNVKTFFRRQLDKLDDGSITKHAICIKIAYSDWVEDYCEENELKPEDIQENIIYESIPLKTSDYYASEEEQEKFKKIANAKDQQLCQLEEWWHEDMGQTYRPTLWNVSRFITKVMCFDRKIRVIRAKRDRESLCICLHAYINKMCSPEFTYPNNYKPDYIRAEEMLEKSLGSNVTI